MKRGFTLIELLIVMVVVGVLMTVAVPQYRRSAERGRATIGLSDLRQIADRTNAWYIMHDNTYPGFNNPNGSDEFGQVITPRLELVGSNDFTIVGPTLISNNYRVGLMRNASSGWEYTIFANLGDGQLSSITCVGIDCASLGLDNL